MQIWALILIIYFIGAILLRDNFSEMVFRSDGAIWIVLVAIGLITAAFAGHIRNLLSFLSEDRHRRLFALIAMLSIAGIEYYNTEYNLRTRPAPPETAALAILPTEFSIQRSWDGHFRAIAQVNHADIGLLIDTGASLVLLRHDDADRIGLLNQDLEYTTPLTTASGRAYVAPVTIGSLTIGGVTVHNVKAAVAKQGALHSSLLGMSFLEQLDEIVIRKNLMILRE